MYSAKAYGVFSRLFFRLSLVAACLILVTANANGGALENSLTRAYNQWIPAYSNVGPLRVKSVRFNDARKTALIITNETAGCLHYTPENYKLLIESLRKALPQAKRNYAITIKAGKQYVHSLILDSAETGPVPIRHSSPVIYPHRPHFDKGLTGINIALWPSHGRFFDMTQNRWRWQRSCLFTTVEDLFTRSYVLPLLLPMLENAGAYTLCPIERDTARIELIIDPDIKSVARAAYSERNGSHPWSEGGIGFGGDIEIVKGRLNPFTQGSHRQVAATAPGTNQSLALYEADIPSRGDYAIYVSYATVPESVNDAHYTVHSMAGDKPIIVNQKMGGGTWIYLGTFPLDKGRRTIVTLTNASKHSGIVTADAVKIGGGMGNVARSCCADSADVRISGMPRWTEGARYWLQWAGAPDSVYSPSNFEDDYADDYKSRGLWVNYLSGGSPVNPSQTGLGIPIDLAFAWHSDAGINGADSIVGSLAIYSTDSGSKLGDGAIRMNSRHLAQMVQRNIVKTARRLFEPSWTQRKLWDRAYAEARSPMVPVMILEFLSHQNFADMRLGLDPAFRFAMARAVYAGMLEYLSKRYNRPFTLQPLPPREFSIENDGGNSFTLSWKETVDTLFVADSPTHYIVEMRTDNGVFLPVAEVNVPQWHFKNPEAGTLYWFRIVACNAGGHSFPSEVLAAGRSGSKGPVVNIVNGFTRLSAPDFDCDSTMAGFAPATTAVAWGADIATVGEQYDYDRTSPWISDENPGFGATHDNMSPYTLRGNTFDFTARHGRALLNAGRSFVSQSLEAFCAKPNIIVGTTDLILGLQQETTRGSLNTTTVYKVFPKQLQKAIKTVTSHGGSIIVSGAFVGSDIWDNPFSSADNAAADIDFAQNTLGFSFQAQQGIDAFNCAVGGGALTSGLSLTATPGGEVYLIETADIIEPSNPKMSKILLEYLPTRNPAALATDFGTYKAAVLGFPIEALASQTQVDTLMRLLLESIE